CISRSPSAIRSRPLKTMRPPAIRPGRCTSRSSESAVTDLPLPDSPTRQSVSPSLTWKLTSITAGATPDGRSKTVLRRSTVRRETDDRGPSTEDRPAAPEDGAAVASPPPDLGPRAPDLGLSGIDFLVLAEDGTHRVRDLADRGVRLHRADDRRHQVVAPARRRADGVDRGAPRRLVARGPHLPDAPDLRRFDRRIDLQGLYPPSPLRGFGETSLRLVRWVIFHVAVHADDDGLSGVDALLGAIGRVLDLALDVGRLDRGERPAEAVDRVEQRARLALDAVGQLFDRRRSPHRVHGVGDAALE